MKNCININTTKEGTVININENASQKEIIDSLIDKLIELKRLYKHDTTPIIVTGKVLKNDEIDEIESLIKSMINVEVTIDSPRVLGLAQIERTYRKNTLKSETLFYKGSLRSGQKLEFEGSIVISGDVNDGAEVLAQDNIAVIGRLRGLAHAGAKGNIGAKIYAGEIEATQLRIGNVIYKKDKKQEKENKDKNKVFKYAYIDKKNCFIIE